MFEMISVKDASEKWGVSEQRIQKLCEENTLKVLSVLAAHGQFRKMQISRLIREGKAICPFRFSLE